VVEITLVSAIGNGLFWGTIAGAIGALFAQRKAIGRLTLYLIPLAIAAGFVMHLLFRESMKLSTNWAVLPWAISFLIAAGVSTTISAFDAPHHSAERRNFLPTVLAIIAMCGIAFGGMYKCSAQTLGQINLDSAKDEVIRKQKEKEQAEPPELSNGGLQMAAEELIRDRLFDPEAARFRNETFHKSPGKTAVVCGEVNAKNRYGGYTGYQSFISNGLPGTTLLANDNPKAVRGAWRKLCGSDTIR